MKCGWHERQSGGRLHMRRGGTKPRNPAVKGLTETVRASLELCEACTGRKENPSLISCTLPDCPQHTAAILDKETKSALAC